MAIIGLNLPTEIPWERICVTHDMVARDGHNLPGKWRSSIAVFKYVPQEEYQTYPEREISYLKLTTTICGFQHRDKEIEGRIDWTKLTETNIANVNELLDHYHPCTGALLQLTVYPSQGAETIRWEDYPYLMDFQPKKRELYEMATDTKEHMSRSLEGISVRKASGTTESLEVLDIDHGTSMNFSVLGQVGVGFGASDSGQVGTKRLSSQEESIARGTDLSREKRESQSHTTQLSQTYHLFDAYHQGTNRGVFFIQPRPHTLEEPSGFVRGPRPVEGIQEIFVVVNRPKAGPDYCVSVRLDTAHYVKVPIMGYGYSDEEVRLTAQAAPPGFRDPNAEPAPNRAINTTVYECRVSSDKKSLVWVPPVEYVLDPTKNPPFTVEENVEEGGGDNQHFVEGPAVILKSEATGKSCYKRPGGRPDKADPNLPNPAFVQSSLAKQRVRIHLRTVVPNKVVGEREELMITTRGLDCCSQNPSQMPGTREGIVDVRPMKERSVLRKAAEDRRDASNGMAGANNLHQGQIGGEDRMSAREANRISDEIRGHLQQSAAKRERGEKVVSVLDTDLFGDLLQAVILNSSRFQQLAKPVCECLPERLRERLRQHYGAKIDTLTRHDITAFDTGSLSELTGLDPVAARRLRLELLGLSFVESKPTDDSPRPDDAKGSALGHRGRRTGRERR